MTTGDLTGPGRPAQGGLRREVLVAASFLGWAICFTVAMRVLRSGVVTSLPLAWLIAAVPSVAAVWILVGYTRYLRAIDELQRLIQLQAMGWGFGGGFFALCGYLLFVPLGAPELDASTVATVMPVLFAIGTLVGSWRYR
jgi:hypothetical protein